MPITLTASARRSRHVAISSTCVTWHVRRRPVHSLRGTEPCVGCCSRSRQCACLVRQVSFGDACDTVAQRVGPREMDQMTVTGRLPQRPPAGLDPGCRRNRTAPVRSGPEGRSTVQDPPNRSPDGLGGLPVRGLARRAGHLSACACGTARRRCGLGGAGRALGRSGQRCRTSGGVSHGRRVRRQCRGSPGAP
jgi:hypothetical protein